MSQKKEEIRIEPRMKAVVFDDRSITAWTPDKHGYPNHGQVALKDGKGKPAVVYASFDVDIKAIVITCFGAVDVSDKLIQDVIDRVTGHNDDTHLIIDTPSSHFDDDMRAYNRMCGREISEPRSKLQS